MVLRDLAAKADKPISYKTLEILLCPDNLLRKRHPGPNILEIDTGLPVETLPLNLLDSLLAERIDPLPRTGPLLVRIKQRPLRWRQTDIQPHLPDKGDHVRIVPEERRRESIILPDLLGLLVQHPENLCIECIPHHQRPYMHLGLGLPVPVQPAVPLLKPVRVPRQLVVNDLVGHMLEVHPLADAVGRDQNPILRPDECLHHLVPVLLVQVAVHGKHMCRIDALQLLRYFSREIVQRILVPGEDQDLPRAVLSSHRQVQVAVSPGELPELAVLRRGHVPCHLHQVPETLRFRFQCRQAPVNHLVETLGRLLIREIAVPFFIKGNRLRVPLRDCLLLPLVLLPDLLLDPLEPVLKRYL